MTVLIIAGEISGDLYASYLCRAVKSAYPEQPIAGIGGEKLKEEVDTFLHETVHIHGVGIEAKIASFRHKKSLESMLKKAIHTQSISRVVIVDFQHYNQIIANVFTQHEIPIYTFITPNFWMWKSCRQAKKICAYSKKIFTIFQPEYDFYKAMHTKTYYFGHPMTEIIPPIFYPILKPKTHPTITLLPGSRPQEFKLYFKAMLQTLRLLRHDLPSINIHICVSSSYYDNTIKQTLSNFNDLSCQLFYGNSSEILSQSDLIFCASGSATLEAVLLNKPLIVFAALPHLTYFIAKYIVKLPLTYISLPNFLTQSYLVPEFVQYDIKPKIIAQTALSILRNPQQSVADYSKVKECLSLNQAIFANIAKEIMM